MATPTVNDLLSSILGQITVMNKNIQGGVSKSDPKMSKLTDPVSSIKSKLGDVSGVANSIATLAKIQLKDVAKVSVMPLGIISKKLKEYVDTLGSVTPESIKSAEATTKGFGELMKLIDDINVKKLTKTLKKFPEKELTQFVNTIGKVLEDINNKITKQFTGAKQKILNEALSSLRTFVKDITDTIKKMSVIGLVGTIAFPFILLGFGITALTLTGLNYIGIMIETLGNPSKATKNKIATNNLTGMAKGALLILVASMAIGAFLLFVPNAMKILGFGLGTVVLTVAAFGAISYVLDRVIGGGKAEKNMQNVKNILAFAGGAMLVAMASIVLGTLVLASETAILVGLGATFSVIGAFAGIAWLLGKANKTFNEAKKPIVDVMWLAVGSILLTGLMLILGKHVNDAGGWAAMGSAMAAVGLTVLEFGAIAFALGKFEKHFKEALHPAVLVIGLGFLSVALTSVMIDLGAKMKEAGGWATIGNALGAVAATVTEFGIIAALMGKLKSVLLKGSLAYSLILGLGYFTVKLTSSVVDLGAKMKEAGGWATLGPSLGAVAAIIGEFTLIAAAIGGLMMVPFLPLVLGAGIAAVAAIGGATLLVAEAGNKVMDMAIKMKNYGGISGPMGNLREFINASRALMLDMRKMGRGIDFVGITKTMFLLNRILDSVSKFARILFGVGGKVGYMKSISGYDSNGKPIFDPEGIDVKLTSQNIAEGFAIFSEIVITKLDELKDKTVKFNTIAALTAIMNPVAKFTEILKSFATDKEGQIQIVHIDKEGKITGKEIIDIPKVSKSIAVGFGIFTNIILNALKEMDASFKDVFKSIKIAAIMTPIMELVDNMKNVLDNDTRPQMMQNAFAIAQGLSVLRQFVFNQLKGFENLPSKRTIRRGTESVIEFAQLLKDAFQNEDERKKFLANTMIVARGLILLSRNVLRNLIGFDETPSKRTVRRGTESLVEFAQMMKDSLKNSAERAAFYLNTTHIARALGELNPMSLANISAVAKLPSKKDVQNGAEALYSFAQKIKDTFLDETEANKFVKNAFSVELGIGKLNKLYLGIETKNLNKVLPVLTKNHVEFISKMGKELHKIKDPLKKYTESVERLADAYDKLNANFDADGKLVLTLDESTVNNTTYNFDKNSIGAFSQTLDETLSGVIPRMADAIRDVIDGAQLNVPEIKLPNGRIPAMVLDVEAGS